ncbi:hypothetical protein NBRC10513v2_000856 [Rhodotorula toruloides]|uniref:Alpha/Beta hydrolase fold n=2 Tax=Rhodotorula toruloides TaxID=5286 RepID=A0A2T0AH33_RHOTO|nr:Alpha/Beta hydrolase fold [Rhodotorula toruloides]
MTDFARALPEFRAFLRTWNEIGGFPFDKEPAEGARPFLASFPAAPAPEPSLATTGNVEIDSSSGKLRLVVVKPVNVSKPPVVVAIHGGGGVVGVPECALPSNPPDAHMLILVVRMDFPLYTAFAQAGFAVVSPDYRLAPEHRMPAALDDVESAWIWATSQEAAAAGFDTSRVAVYGSSAGSNLAAGLAIRLKNQAKKAPALTLLDSVLADDRVDLYNSMQPDESIAPYHIWKRSDAERVRHWLYGDRQDLSVEEAPLRSQDPVKDFGGLGPHYLSVCELDSLLSHGLSYARSLYTANVPTSLHVWGGAPHAFATLCPGTELAMSVREEYVRALKGAFGEEL